MRRTQRPMATSNVAPSPQNYYGDDDWQNHDRYEPVISGQHTSGSRPIPDARPQYVSPGAMGSNEFFQQRSSRIADANQRGFGVPMGSQQQYQAPIRTLGPDGFYIESRRTQPLSAPPRPVSQHPKDWYQSTAVFARPYESEVSKQIATQRQATAQPQRSQGLLMFGDDPETGSAMTGWSEQELLKKQSNAQGKRKEKPKYGKKKDKKKKEARILNLPPSLSRTSPSRNKNENLKPFSRKKYSRGADEPLGDARPVAPQAKPKNHIARYGVVRKKMQPAAPTVPVESSRGQNWRLMSRSSEEASSTAGSSQGSFEVPEVDNTLQMHQFDPSNHYQNESRSADLISSVRERWDRPGADVPQFSTNPFDSTAENNAEMMQRSVLPSNGSDNAQHVDNTEQKVKASDEEVSISSFPLLSTDASRHQQHARTFQDGSFPSGFKSSSSSTDSHSSASVRELLEGSFPSPNRASSTVQRAGRVGMSVRFAEDINGAGEPQSNMGAETPSPSRFEGNGTTASKFSFTKVAKDSSPTSVVHLQQNVTTQNMDSQPSSNVLSDPPQRKPPNPPRKPPKSILRTRRVVTDCPSDEGSRLVEQNEVRRRVRIAIAEEETRGSHIPARANETKVVGEKVVALSPIRHSAPTSFPPSPAEKTETTLDYSQSTEATPQLECMVDNRQFLGSFEQNSNDFVATDGVEGSEEDYSLEYTHNIDFIEAVAAVVIQTAVRRFLAMQSFEQMYRAMYTETTMRKEGDYAVTVAQTESFEDMAVRMYDLAAVQIQSMFRGWWVRDSLQVDHFCSRIIQRTVRGYLCRMKFQFILYCIVLVQTVWRRNLALNAAASRLAYVMTIQSFYRGYRVRKEINNYRKHAAATTIQARWRSYFLQEKYLHKIGDILVVQSVARRWFAKSRLLPYIKGRTDGNVRRNRRDEVGNRDKLKPKLAKSTKCVPWEREQESEVAAQGSGNSEKTFPKERSIMDCVRVSVSENVQSSAQEPAEKANKSQIMGSFDYTVTPESSSFENDDVVKHLELESEILKGSGDTTLAEGNCQKPESQKNTDNPVLAGSDCQKQCDHDKRSDDVLQGVKRQTSALISIWRAREEENKMRLAKPTVFERQTKQFQRQVAVPEQTELESQTSVAHPPQVKEGSQSSVALPAEQTKDEAQPSVALPPPQERQDPQSPLSLPPPE